MQTQDNTRDVLLKRKPKYSTKNLSAALQAKIGGKWAFARIFFKYLAQCPCFETRQKTHFGPYIFSRFPF